MSEDNKLKLFTEELKMLQDIIKRMADNSFKLKGWCVAIVIIALIFRAKIDSFIAPLIPLIAFGILDTYYLALERQFRIVYNKKVAKFKNGDFEGIFEFKIKGNFSYGELCGVAKSKSIWLFYGAIFVLVAISNSI